MIVFFKREKNGYVTQDGELITPEMLAKYPHVIDHGWGQIELPHDMFFFRNRVSCSFMAGIARIHVSLTGLPQSLQQNIYRNIKNYLKQIEIP